MALDGFLRTATTSREPWVRLVSFAIFMDTAERVQ